MVFWSLREKGKKGSLRPKYVLQMSGYFIGLIQSPAKSKGIFTLALMGFG